MPRAAAAPTLMTIAQAASLLAVSEKTVRRWIAGERIPTCGCPAGATGSLRELLASLGGNYSLGDELAEIDARTTGLTEDEVRAAVD
jgi:hypothetical protein